MLSSSFSHSLSTVDQSYTNHSTWFHLYLFYHSITSPPFCLRLPTPLASVCHPQLSLPPVCLHWSLQLEFQADGKLKMFSLSLSLYDDKILEASTQIVSPASYMLGISTVKITGDILVARVSWAWQRQIQMEYVFSLCHILMLLRVTLKIKIYYVGNI